MISDHATNGGHPVGVGHRLRITVSTSRRGVAMIFFVLVFGLLLGFFMLIANTGMLIYQKVRLQTAVDLASYAAAAVQASYLGNRASGEESISSINYEIMERYQKLLADLQNQQWAPWPNMIAIPGAAGAVACASLCNAANYGNAKIVEGIYKSAAADMDQLRQKAIRIMEQLPEAARKAAEATLKANIPELAVDDGDAVSRLASSTTNKWEDVTKTNTPLDKKKNAVLGFTSEKGLYLANIVAAVPHAFPYYGPYCFNQILIDNQGQPNLWYCTVNGAGYPPGEQGYKSARLAYAKSFAPLINGNVGTVASISDTRSNAIRLNFVQNHHRPGPFFVSAAEWYPENGSLMNLENSLGAKGSLFPQRTRLVALSAAEPFGSDLAMGGTASSFGVRLQSIRKLLLDPRMALVKPDFPGLYEYMESLSPKNREGKPTEKSETVIRRFLH